MKCPFCRSDQLKVLETRETTDTTTRRRKACQKCQRRFTTYENIDTINIQVIKRDGAKKPFDRDKILNSVKNACGKREPDENIQSLVEEVVEKVHSLNKKEIRSTKIGMYVLNRLKKLDKIAYLRYAALHRGFDDLKDIKQELNKLE